MTQIMQAVLLCGGLGTRLRPFTYQSPKPLVPCSGRPFLLYLFEQLSEQGINRFLLLTGYLGEKIQNYFGDGSDWGWEIDYSQGPVEWETGQRIWESREHLDERFLLLYSDNFVPFPLQRVLDQHQSNKAGLTFMASPKSPGNVSINSQGLVEVYDNKRGKDRSYVEIGYMVVERLVLLSGFEKPNCSLSEVLGNLARHKQVSAWVQHDAYHSISDPDRWKLAERYLYPKKIIFLDRDGVINKKAPRGEYIERWEDFIWIEETLQDLVDLSQQGFQFIVITNQAGIARGRLSQDRLNYIHEQMIQVLSGKGIEILKVYICPHHWEDGCECRKPRPGMLYQASRDFLIRLDRTVFVGDDPRDMEAAKSAGCRGILFNQQMGFSSEVIRCFSAFAERSISFDGLPKGKTMV